MEQKLEQLKIHLDEKFEVQKESISEINEICNSMFKNFENNLNEKSRKQNKNTENLQTNKCLRIM